MTQRAIETLRVATTSTPLRPGQSLVWRLFAQERLTCIRTGVLVAHDERGLRLWFAPGNPGLDMRTANGQSIRDMPFSEWIRRETELTPVEWFGPDVLIYVRPEAAHSVWWFFGEAREPNIRHRGEAREPNIEHRGEAREPNVRHRGDAQLRGSFAEWYVNLEEPAVVWHDGELVGVDTTDQDLDIHGYPDGTWAWKDEEEFAERLGFPDAYWVADGAAVRAEGERTMRAFEAGEFPFDGTWCDWAPDPVWRHPTTVPAEARRPRVHYGR